MIVNSKTAQEAWNTLRTYARMSDEKWDADELSNVRGRSVLDVTDAYRASVKFVHPDMGGSAEEFAKVDRAKGLLLEWLKRLAGESEQAQTPGMGRKCYHCDGKGFVTVHRAFRTMRMQCPRCKGTGDLDSEHEKGDFR